MIPALYNRRMSAVDSVIAQAVLIMVIDDSADLQVGVYRDCTDVFETALLQVPADLIRQTVADRNRSCVVSLIEDRFPIGKALDIIAEAAEFLPHLSVTPRVVDHCLHFA